MDIYDAATYFDGLQVTDAYDDSELFTAQMDQYDATARDGMTSWRRSCSAAVVVMPDRRVVEIDGQPYIAGRRIRDYFQDQVIREHLLLHPSDGLFTCGTAADFLAEYSLSLTTLYGTLALRKELKEEAESSQYFSLYNIYIALGEVVSRDQIVQSPAGGYYRVQSVEQQTGEYQTLYVSDLSFDALVSVAYTSGSGVYDVASDQMIAGPSVAVNAFLERYQTNYRYLVDGALKFQEGDRVLTVSASDISEPAMNDRVQIDYVDYRVLSVQSDGLGGWELHIRRAQNNLAVET